MCPLCSYAWFRCLCIYSLYMHVAVVVVDAVGVYTGIDDIELYTCMRLGGYAGLDE